MRPFNFIKLALIFVFFVSCSKEEDKETNPKYFIGANTMDNTMRYAQTVFDGGNSDQINVFDSTGKTMLMQSYKNGSDEKDGYWSIRLLGLDIENLTLPYTLTGIEGSVVWVDESVRPLQAPCSGADILCFYAGVGVDEVTITINHVENNSISGTFSGRLYHIMVNPEVTKETKDFVDVSEGAFSIQYQVD